MREGYTKGKLLTELWFFQNFDFFLKFQIFGFFYLFTFFLMSKSNYFFSILRKHHLNQSNRKNLWEIEIRVTRNYKFCTWILIGKLDCIIYNYTLSVMEPRSFSAGKPKRNSKPVAAPGPRFVVQYFQKK